MAEKMLQTIIDGLVIFFIVMALAGFELSERPWYQPDPVIKAHRVGDPWPDPVYRLPAESRKYLTKKTKGE